jgi:hypothetical protein
VTFIHFNVLFTYYFRFILRPACRPKGRPSEGRKHTKFNKSKHLCLPDKGMETISEQQFPVGLLWKTPKLANTCTVDNFFTALIVQCWENKHFLQYFGSTSAEIQLLTAMNLILDNKRAEGKYHWANYLNGFQDLDFYNLYGTPCKQVLDHLKPAFTFQSIAECLNCNVQINQPFTYIHIPVTSDVSCYLDGYLTTGRLPLSCSVCNSTTVQQTGTKMTTCSQ